MTGFFSSDQTSAKKLSTDGSIFLEKLLAHDGQVKIAFDYETTGLRPFRHGHRIVTCAVCVDDDEKSPTSLSFSMTDPAVRRLWKKVLVDESILKIAHNLKFEHIWGMHCLGVKTRGWIWDTIVAARILDNQCKSVSLEAQAQRHLGVEPYKSDTHDVLRASAEEKKIFGSNAFNGLACEKMASRDLLARNRLDALYTMKLYRKQSHAFKFQQAYQLFQDGLLALADIEVEGIRVDAPYLREVTNQLTDKILQHEKNIWKMRDVAVAWKKHFGKLTNINSILQQKYIFFKHLKYMPLEVTPTGLPCLDDKALLKIEHPLATEILETRKLKKMRDTYISSLLSEQTDGIIHPSYNLSGVSSFRSSCSAPNFQNVPVHDPIYGPMIRKSILPRDDEHQIGEVDYCFTGDTLIETIEGSIPIKNIALSYLKKKVHVFCYDNDKQRIAIAPVTDGRCTRRNAEIWKVILDNGAEIKVTPDHSFIKRTGEKCSVRELQVGDSLMPFYRRTKRKKNYHVNYTEIYLNNGKHCLAHNLIAEDVFNTSIPGSNMLVHHINGNGCDNSLENLQIMDRKEHFKIHSKQGWRHVGKGNRFEWHKSKENREFLAEASKKRAAQWTKLQRIEFGLRISKSIQARGGYWGKNNPMFGKQQSEESNKKNKITHTKRRVIRPAPKCACGCGLDVLNRKGSRHKWNVFLKGHAIILPGTKKKLSVALTGRITKESAKVTLKNKALLRWADPVFREKMKPIFLATWEKRKKIHNHKIAKVFFYGYEDVYNITVEKHHNYALAAGIVVCNCALEVRIAACYHKDPTMLAYINDPTKDLHKDMTCRCFKLKPEQVTKSIRFIGKNGFVFPENYGAFWVSIASAMWEAAKKEKLADGTPLLDHLAAKGITYLGELEKEEDSDYEHPKTDDCFYAHIQRIEVWYWTKKFPVYAAWRKSWVKAYKLHERFDTLTGFRCQGTMRRTEVINLPVQGSAFHCLLWSICQINTWLLENDMDTRIIGQIHDSIVLDIYPPELETLKKKVKQVMCEDVRKHWSWIITPLSVEMELSPPGKSWNDKKSEPI